MIEKCSIGNMNNNLQNITLIILILILIIVILFYIRNSSLKHDELVEKNKKMVKGGGVDDIKIDNNNRYDIAILFDNTNNKYIIEKEKIINLLNKFSFVVIDATFNKTMTDKKYDLLYIKLNYSENYKEKLSLLELLKELSKLENNYESIDDVVVFTKKYRGGRPIEKKDFYES